MKRKYPRFSRKYPRFFILKENRPTSWMLYAVVKRPKGRIFQKVRSDKISPEDRFDKNGYLIFKNEKREEFAEKRLKDKKYPWVEISKEELALMI